MEVINIKKLLIILFISLLISGCAKSPELEQNNTDTNTTNNSEVTNTKNNSSGSTIDTNNSISNNQSKEPEISNKPTSNHEIFEYANEIVKALKDRDFNKLATFVSDDMPLGFSPYSNADFNTMIYLTPSEVSSIPSDNRMLTWGVSDGSGEPIELIPLDYFDKYVYDKDFYNAPEISLDNILGAGSMIDNTSNSSNVDHFVEYHFPSFDPQYEGMDWESLRLAFHVDDNGVYKLVLIIHDCWTI